MEFRKWQKIGQFHNTRKSINERIDYQRINGEEVEVPRVTYRGKVKLDGTNAAIRIAGGVVGAQSRTRMISVDDDNYGFARFVQEVQDWALAVGSGSGAGDVAIYGEWCGSGIQKRCSVSKCEKMFVVFAVALDDRRISAPGALRDFLGDKPANVYVLDWQGDAIVVDYGCEDSVDKAVNAMCAEVARVEACDPWVREHFGHEGIGEGLVYYPTLVERAASMPDDMDLLFKAKGEKHENVKQLKPVLKDPEVVASIAAFVTKFVTEDRMQQGLAEIGCSTPSMKDTGTFLKWIGNDVRSESADELEVAGLVWSDVAKSGVSSRKGLALCALLAAAASHSYRVCMSGLLR